MRIFRIGCALAALFVWGSAQAALPSCGEAVRQLNERLQPRIDAAELEDALETLNASKNRRLPDRFVTKKKAQELGWRPGKDLWSVRELRGKSIGGDRFGNREGRLPAGNWREADLDYKGGHRGAKRLLFSDKGDRRVTVDHYRTFVAVQACQ